MVDQRKNGEGIYSNHKTTINVTVKEKAHYYKY